ncbi:hypothetical protein [Rahnella inusitata]|uniref:hypothetical protein n=1 Tax=Rahnella inusitata TaxID=58169 RepID=UPI0039B12280
MSVGIIAAGCSFPSGPTLALADIAVRTQFSLTRQHPFVVDRCDKPVKASYFPQHELTFDISRWQVIADNAVEDALLSAGEYAALPSRLWLILPPAERPGVPLTLASALTASISLRLPDCLQIVVLRGGHAEAGNAILQIRQLQTQDRALTIDIVVAVESWLPPETLMWLEDQHLLHNSHSFYKGEARSNPYGRIPSEGAAVLILVQEKSLPCWCHLQGISTGQERVLRDDDQPCLALGLSGAAQAAIKLANTNAVSHLFTDVNGEIYRFDEYGFTLSRLSGVLRDNFQRVAPVLASGDLGCASLITHLALAAWQLKAETETGTETGILVLSSSDDHQRCAVVLKPLIQGVEKHDNHQY